MFEHGHQHGSMVYVVAEDLDKALEALLGGPEGWTFGLEDRAVRVKERENEYRRVVGEPTLNTYSVELVFRRVG